MRFKHINYKPVSITFVTPDGQIVAVYASEGSHGRYQVLDGPGIMEGTENARILNSQEFRDMVNEVIETAPRKWETIYNRKYTG